MAMTTTRMLRSPAMGSIRRSLSFIHKLLREDRRFIATLLPAFGYKAETRTPIEVGRHAALHNATGTQVRYAYLFCIAARTGRPTECAPDRSRLCYNFNLEQGVLCK